MGALIASCNSKAPPPDEPSPAAPQAATQPQAASDQSSRISTAPKALKPPGPRSPAPAPAEIWTLFSGDKAFTEVSKQVAIGPRPSGSANLEKARGAILASLNASGWDVEKQEFTDHTPHGPIKFTNLIARFSASTERPASSATQRAIVCSHYDTKHFSTISFVGASDGASSTGALLELARVLAFDPVLASKVELVFFDGEEAIVQFDDADTDGLYGSRFYAKTLRTSQRAKQFKFGILWDMIGDKDLTITLPTDSPETLVKEIFAAADSLGVRSHFGYFDRAIKDDHYPLNRIQIPTIDLIDFNYLPWHTADDTLDKLSPESLRTVGAVTLLQLRKALSK